jgi:hypothetical protein
MRERSPVASTEGGAEGGAEVAGEDGEDAEGRSKAVFFRRSFPRAFPSPSRTEVLSSSMALKEEARRRLLRRR